VELSISAQGGGGGYGGKNNVFEGWQKREDFKKEKFGCWGEWTLKIPGENRLWFNFKNKGQGLERREKRKKKKVGDATVKGERRVG